MVEKSWRNGFYNTWATKVLKSNGRVICRLQRMKDIDRNFRIKIICRTRKEHELLCGKDMKNSTPPEGAKKKISRNARNQKKKIKEKFGIKIPKSTHGALLLDRANGDNK